MEYIGERPLRNVGEIPTRGARCYGDKRAVASDMGEQGYEELNERSNRVARILRENGLEEGDRVGTYLPNTLKFPETYFGVLKAGGVVVPLNLMLDDGSLRYVLEDSDVRHLVSTPLLVAGIDRDRVSVTAPQDLVEGTGVEKLYTSGLSAGEDDDFEVVDYKTETSEPVGDDFEITDRAEDDLAVQMYTSGTTGDPKGVLLTHTNILKSLESFTRTNPRIDPDSTVLVVLPLFHIYGLNILLSTYLYSGGTVVLQTTPEPRSILEAIEEYEIEMFPAVPAIFRTVHDEYTSSPDEYDLSALRGVGSGAAPLPKELKEEITDGWGVTMSEGWAMTETAASGTVRREGSDLWKPSGCVGKPMRDIELKIAEAETRETLVPPDVLNPETPPPDEEYVGAEGEIAIRGPQIFEGYHGLPEKTEEVFDDKGWFYTEDIARVDEDGDLWIQGRTDDMILVGGENVYPEQVENVLNDHPAVDEAGAAGVAHEVKGSAPVAFVVLRDNGDATEEELRRYALENMPSYAHPRRVFFVNEVPRSATRKVQRFKLRERAKERIKGGELKPSERL